MGKNYARHKNAENAFIRKFKAATHPDLLMKRNIEEPRSGELDRGDFITKVPFTIQHKVAKEPSAWAALRQAQKAAPNGQGTIPMAALERRHGRGKARDRAVVIRPGSFRAFTQWLMRDPAKENLQRHGKAGFWTAFTNDKPIRSRPHSIPVVTEVVKIGGFDVVWAVSFYEFFAMLEYSNKDWEVYRA